MILKSVLVISLCVFLVSCEHKRVKRGKYQPYPSQSYRRPPPRGVKGAYSYNPRPNYKPKVSNIPIYELGNEDINNLVKYLSKQDLDKIIEFANEKETINKNNYSQYGFDDRESFKRLERTTYKEDAPYIKDHEEGYKLEYDYNSMDYIPVRPTTIYVTPPPYPENADRNLNNNFIHDEKRAIIAQDSAFVNHNYADNGNTKFVLNSNMNPHAYSINTLNSNTPLNIEKDDEQTYYVTPPSDEKHQYSDSSSMKEEELPKPLNLRDDYEISYTNNVPTYAKSDYYKVESFKDVPLMNSHNSKLHTVSSYYVPHYTVTSPQFQQVAQSLPKAPPIEPAPPAYSVKDQTDAHLKAIKIWTHRSKGTAYTLHDDGTLSIEKPGRPKSTYGL